jgi:hypothetical protein
MRLKRHQIITLIAFGAIALAFLMVVVSGALVSAAANSSAFPYRISFKDFAATPTPFQPNAFANILEDGTIELLPQPIYTPTPVPFISQDQLPDNQLNILLLGCDDFSANGFRTDVIMLLSSPKAPLDFPDFLPARPVRYHPGLLVQPHQHRLESGRL